LDQVLAGVPRVANNRVLVGFDTADDAAVYKLTEESALVQTLDFFTPIVDDPFTFGAIAAANSLSDVYAMGGTPLTALSILCYPANGDLDDLGAIMRGGAAKLAEAECALVGGHSVADDEVKFGFSITGIVDPRAVRTNAHARAGDVLVLTKGIGTGVIATALKRGIAAEAHVEAAIASMLELNRAACEAGARAGKVHGCTDITGFGLLGHAREVAVARGVTLDIDAERVPLLAGALEYARAGAIPGGLRNNREFIECAVERTRDLAPELADLMYDPQTSGGLLLTLPEDAAAQLLSDLPGARIIGRVTERGGKPVRLLLKRN
jgi:selenide,water dikinase